MKLETLVSAVREDVAALAEKMNLQSDAVIINQCDENTYLEYEYGGNTIRGYSFAEKGVGLSRNNALLRAKADIVLFSDEDIVYHDGYIVFVSIPLIKSSRTKPTDELPLSLIITTSSILHCFSNLNPFSINL